MGIITLAKSKIKREDSYLVIEGKLSRDAAKINATDSLLASEGPTRVLAITGSPTDAIVSHYSPNDCGEGTVTVDYSALTVSQLSQLDALLGYE